MNPFRTARSASTSQLSLWSRTCFALLTVFLGAIAPAHGQQCRPPLNLLEETDFVGAGGAGLWMARQHARSGSYALAVDDGVLSITKVGKEPWYTLTQTVAKGGLSGRTVRYEADLKLNITDPTPAHGFPYEAGLFFGARNRQKRYLIRSVAEHEPDSGDADWQRIVLEFEIPAKVSELEAGFFHQAGGPSEALMASAVAVVVVDRPESVRGTRS